MWINPLNMLLEADHLNEISVADLTGRTFVDEDARLITQCFTPSRRSHVGRIGVGHRRHHDDPARAGRIRARTENFISSFSGLAGGRSGPEVCFLVSDEPEVLFG